MDNIYEGAYQYLLDEGYEDTDATEIVNHLYENGELDGVEVLDENAFRAIRALTKVFGGSRKGWVNMQRMNKYMTGGGLSPAMKRRTSGKTLNLQNIKTPRQPVSGKSLPPATTKTGPVGGYTDPLARGSVANASAGQFSRSTRASQILQQPSGLGKDAGAAARQRLTGASRNPDAGIAASRRLRGGMAREATPVKVDQEVAKKVKLALSPTKSGKGGPLAKTGLTAGLGPVPKVEPIKIRDLGSTPSSGGPTRYQGTRSGGQLPPSGETTSRMGKGRKKAEIAAAGATNVGPATPTKGSPKPPELPAAGQTSSRRSVAAATAAAAAAGTTGTGVRTGTTSAIVKRSSSLVDKVKNVMKGKGGKIATGAALLGLTGLAASKLGDGGQRGGVTKPEGGVLADKESPKTPSAPKVTTPKTPAAPKATTPKTPAAPKKSESKVTTAAIKKKMTKIDKDVEELMQMRASSMERQGRTKEAEELRGKIKAKYGDYER